MAFSINTSVQLPTAPDVVWAILTDFASYPDWNPFITRAEGDWSPGNKVAVTAGDMDFKPIVLRFEANRELRWCGSLFFKGLFDGEHYFRLLNNSDGTTTLEHGEHFQGILTPILKAMILEKTQAGFEAMNAALAQRVKEKLA